MRGGPVRDVVLRVLQGVRAQVSEVRDLEELRQPEGARVVLMDAHSASARPLPTVLRHYRAADRTSAVLLCLTAGDPELHRLAQLARAGVDGVYVVTHADERAELVREIEARLRHPLARHISGDLVPPPNTIGRSVVGWCARRGYEGFREQEIAERFGVSVRSLQRGLLLTEWHSVRRAEDMARLAHVATLLDDTTLSAERIAGELGFPDAAALSRFVQRVTGRPIRQLREEGAIEMLKSLLRESKRTAQM